MFGHKDGKIKRELKQVEAALNSLHPFFDELVTSGTVDMRKVAAARQTVTMTADHVKNLIALSQRIHDIVEKEL